MMAMGLGNLWNHVKGLIFFGWLVAIIRFALEFVAPEQAMYFGVYYVMPLAYLYYGLTGKLDDLKWPQLALGMVIVAFFVWFLPNSISYTTAQFLELEHGRFAADRAAAIQDSAMGKIISGVSISLVTWVGGAVWSIVFSTLFIWLPGLRRKRSLQST